MQVGQVGVSEPRSPRHGIHIDPEALAETAVDLQGAQGNRKIGPKVHEAQAGQARSQREASCLDRADSPAPDADADTIAQPQPAPNALANDAGPLPLLDLQHEATDGSRHDYHASMPDILEDGQVPDSELSLKPVQPPPNPDISDEEGQCSPHMQHMPPSAADNVQDSHRNTSASTGQQILQASIHAKAGKLPGSLKEPSAEWLSQQLNPNNEAYNPALAEQHRAKRLRSDPTYAHRVARKEKSKLLKRIHWSQKSTLTPAEHGYLIDLQGESYHAILQLCWLVMYLHTPSYVLL